MSQKLYHLLIVGFENPNIFEFSIFLYLFLELVEVMFSQKITEYPICNSKHVYHRIDMFSLTFINDSIIIIKKYVLIK